MKHAQLVELAKAAEKRKNDERIENERLSKKQKGNEQTSQELRGDEETPPVTETEGGTSDKMDIDEYLAQMSPSVPPPPSVEDPTWVPIKDYSKESGKTNLKTAYDSEEEEPNKDLKKLEAEEVNEFITSSQEEIQEDGKWKVVPREGPKPTTQEIIEKGINHPERQQAKREEIGLLRHRFEWIENTHKHEENWNDEELEANKSDPLISAGYIHESDHRYGRFVEIHEVKAQPTDQEGSG